VKCEKPKQPANDQNCGDESQHDVSPYFQCAMLRLSEFAQSAKAQVQWSFLQT
jgi:hypothetical protein